MTIDPSNFEAQGTPTREQARRVWDTLPKPSSRKCAEKLTGMGYSIGFRTIARWQKAGWVEPEKLGAGDERCKSAGEKAVDKALRAEVKKAEQPKDGIDAAITGTQLTDADLARIETAVNELKGKTIAELRDELEKQRLIHNIVLLRESARRANVLALIPKDTSLFIGAYTEDAKAAGPAPGPIGVTPAPGLPAPNGNGHAIEGEFKVVNSTAAAITRFLAKENA